MFQLLILPLAIRSSIFALILRNLMCASTVVFVMFKFTITKHRRYKPGRLYNCRNLKLSMHIYFSVIFC
jgi:hypothetical protein